MDKASAIDYNISIEGNRFSPDEIDLTLFTIVSTKMDTITAIHKTGEENSWLPPHSHPFFSPQNCSARPHVEFYFDHPYHDSNKLCLLCGPV